MCLENNDLWEVHQISSIVVRSEDKQLLNDHLVNYHVSMFFEIHKETGTIKSTWESFDYIYD